MTLEEYLEVPYILVLESFQDQDGEWRRRARFPELPGCTADAQSPLDALDELERIRERIVRQRLADGEPVPVPRPTLRRHA